MKKFVKIGALMLLGAAFAGGMASCSDEYPVQPTKPVVTKVYNISGVVSDRSGNPIANAVITLNGDTKIATDERGYFVFSDVSVGKYNLEASAAGKLPASTTVTISDVDGMNAVWNVMLLSEDIVKEITFKPSVGVNLENAMETGNIKGNDNGSVEVDVDVPADAFDGLDNDDDITITITPIYEEEQADGRARENTMLVGAYVECNKPNAKLKNGQTITVTFHLDKEAVEALDCKKYNGNDFVKYDNYKKAGNNIQVFADELFTSYGLFADVDFTESPRNSALTFNPSVVDNLNGNSSVKIDDCNYTYGVGTKIDVNANYPKLHALLTEALATRYGASVIDNVGAAYPVNMTLPIGFKFTIDGYQVIKDITATCAGQKATAKAYDNVIINTNVTERADHNGGSI